jgi:hypothetical protein
MIEWVSLSEMVGKRVVDIKGYISYEFGDPTFKMITIEYDDGSEDICEGEHDFPYVVVDVPERYHHDEG